MCISADTDWTWQTPRADKVQCSFVNVNVWHHHRELASFCTDRMEAVIRNEWQGAFHLWWKKIFVSKYLTAETVFLWTFLVLNTFCIIREGGRGQNYCTVLLSDKITDVLHLQITNVWMLSYCDINRYHLEEDLISSPFEKIQRKSGVLMSLTAYVGNILTWLDESK